MTGGGPGRVSESGVSLVGESRSVSANTESGDWGSGVGDSACWPLAIAWLVEGLDVGPCPG